MIINFDSSDIVFDTYYYTPAFKTLCANCTLQTTLVSNSSAQIESSVDGLVWFTVSNTAFTCSPSGLQSFCECQIGLNYRLVSTVEITDCKIFI